MLIELIEETRNEMYHYAHQLGFTSTKTVQASQKLDHLLNLQYCKNTSKLNLNNKKVHGSIISNISQALSKYNFHLQNENDGLLNANPNGWYLLRDFKNIFLSVKESMGENVFVDIGKNVPTNCIFPEEINSFEKGILSLNIAYKTNHLFNIEGYYEVFFTERNELFVICNTPFYPYLFNLGIISGLGEKFNVPISIHSINDSKGGEFKIKIKNTF